MSPHPSSFALRRGLHVPAAYLLILTSISPLPAQTELEETVVVASRLEEKTSQTAGSSSAITSDEILESGATSLSDALKYEPGVSVPFDTAGSDGLVPYLAGGDSAVNIRGLEGNRISIDVDGIRQPEDFVVRSFEGAGGPGRIYFDPATFSQIELYKSAASSLYGSDALGGAISGRTESALTLLGPELDGTVVNNTFTYSEVNESIHNRLAHAMGNGTTAFSLLHSYRRGQERKNNSFFPANPAEFNSHAILATLNWKPTPDSVLTFTTDYYLNESNIDTNSAEGYLSAGILNIFVASEDERERLRFSLDYMLQSPTNLFDTFAAKAYWQRATAASDNVQQAIAFGAFRDQLNDIDYKTDIFGINSQATKELAFNQFTYGTELSFSRVESTFFRTQRFPGGSSLLFDLISMAPSDVIRAGTFLQDKMTFGNREEWEITPAIRFDYYSVSPENTDPFLVQSNGQEAADYDNLSLSPSLSILYNFTDSFNLYGSWAQGTRNPSAEELNGVFAHGGDFITVPNPDLTEERSNSFEVGLQFNDDTVNAQVSGYYNLYTDFLENGVLIVDNPPGTPDELTTINRGEVEIYGLEAKADWLLGEDFSPLQGLSVGGSFTWTEGTTNDGSGNPDQPLNSVDPWKSVAYLAYNHPSEKWGSRLTATYSAAKDQADIGPSASQPLQSNSWLTLDLTAYCQLTESLRLRAGLTNLLDEEYVTWATARRGNGHGGSAAVLPNSFYSQPGRSFFVAFDLAF